MKAVLVLFDSLRRKDLPPYGGTLDLPNFERLAARTCTFDGAYVGSMPCMPARRELHTGRYNFLHRGWGPLEPFDDSMPQLLKEAGVHTHLATDHYHYFEDGGCTYHNRYSTWAAYRGQEGDCWVGQVDAPAITPWPDSQPKPGTRQDIVNRQVIRREDETTFPQYQTVSNGLEFIKRNRRSDNWMLQIEAFDPHEPFYAPQKYREPGADPQSGSEVDWPPYRPVQGESEEHIAAARAEYAALVRFCDAQLGRILDKFDEENLWEDTLLIVTTDHGIHLGEHGSWLKNHVAWYNETAHIPFFVHDPRCPQRDGERNAHLVQWIDLAPTLLRSFGQEPTKDMTGTDLGPVLADNLPGREAGLFGHAGNQIALVNERHIYFRNPVQREKGAFNNYTLMPTEMRGFLGSEYIRGMELHPGFGFTKDMPVLRIPTPAGWWVSTLDKHGRNGHALFDRVKDEDQQHPLEDPQAEEECCRQMAALMRAHEAPPEQFPRMGLDGY